jgi:hypothetical protein
MPQDLLRGAFDTLRSRLQAELDSQLVALEARQSELLAETRRAAEQEAEQRWTARLDETRGEWASRLESERAAAAAEADRRLAADAERHRSALEQAVAEVRDTLKQEWEQTLGTERDRAREAAERTRRDLDDLTGELARTRAELAGVRQELERVLAEGQQSAQTLERERAEFQAERQRLVQANDNALSALRSERDRAHEQLEQERTRAGQLDAARSEATALHAEANAAVAAAGADLEALRAVLEQERARIRELDAACTVAVAAQADASKSLAAVRAEIEQARRDGAAAVEAERDRVRTLTASLEEARAALDRAQDESRHATASIAADRTRTNQLEAESRVAERHWRLAIVERMLGSVKAIGSARSLSDTLSALVTAAAAEAPRAALFIVSGSRLQGWRAQGFGATSPATFQAAQGDGTAVGEAARTGDVVSTASAPAPAFAALPPDRAGLAVPVTVGGHAVAVLYVDDGAGEEPEAPASWPEAVQVLGRHASACLAHLTAVRTAQAMRVAPAAAPAAQASRPADDDTSARRYARLLVSEIKLYNEGAVRVGREKRDLLQRLRSEIDRARRLYEERVPDAAGPRSAYFQQELVQVLADGDASLLGEAV